MDFRDSILQFAGRVEKLCPQIYTEAVTKIALNVPFVYLWCYYGFNAFERSSEKTERNLVQISDNTSSFDRYWPSDRSARAEKEMHKVLRNIYRRWLLKCDCAAVWFLNHPV